MACPIVVDLRNIYRPEEFYRKGFAYTGVGRAVSGPTFSDDGALDRVLSPARIRRQHHKSVSVARSDLSQTPLVNTAFCLGVRRMTTQSDSSTCADVS